MDFSAVKIVTGNDVIVGTSGQGIEYTSIWQVFRSKNSLCIRSRTRNNEKDVYFFLEESKDYEYAKSPSMR